MMQLKFILPTILVLMISAINASAQEPRSPERGKRKQETVINEDRGEAYIIGRKPQPPCSSLVSRGTPISEPQQYSIFLGGGWAKPNLQARESELANLLVNVRDQATITALAGCGVRNFFGPTFSREKLDKSGRKVTDLEIQAVLSEMLRDRTLPRLNPATIYVVFLDPELNSTLGTMIAGKHYAAYHNFFNASGIRFHYVVMPFEADQKAAYEIALRAFVAAALNPSHAISN